MKPAETCGASFLFSFPAKKRPNPSEPQLDGPRGRLQGLEGDLHCRPQGWGLMGSASPSAGKVGVSNKQVVKPWATGVSRRKKRRRKTKKKKKKRQSKHKQQQKKKNEQPLRWFSDFPTLNWSRVASVDFHNMEREQQNGTDLVEACARYTQTGTLTSVGLQPVAITLE